MLQLMIAFYIGYTSINICLSGNTLKIENLCFAASTYPSHRSNFYNFCPFRQANNSINSEFDTH
jgi:hypothetical protein